MLSTEGPVAGASLLDWPISYSEMEPYYERAEWEFGTLDRLADGGYRAVAIDLPGYGRSKNARVDPGEFFAELLPVLDIGRPVVVTEP